MLATLRSVAKRLPVIGQLIGQREQLRDALAHMTAERDALRAGSAPPSHDASGHDSALLAATAELAELRTACGFVPPGHYYSPLPALAEIRRDEARIFGPMPRTIPGVDLREREQLALLQEFAKFYPDIPFADRPTAGLRYYYDNQSYSYSDAIMLHCMLRHLKPRRLIEIGSGYSSCVTLDTDQYFLGGTLAATFIEPYPELLLSLTSDADQARITVIPKRLQDVDVEVFKSLNAGDILFIDSTHVSKIDSDVNRLFFDILPVLAPGVVIHFHDIFYPFEYPKEWIYFGRAWNELYMLRTFLQYNNEFSVLLMNTFMAHFHRPLFEQQMPLCLKNTGGSIWLEKHQP